MYDPKLRLVTLVPMSLSSGLEKIPDHFFGSPPKSIPKAERARRRKKAKRAKKSKRRNRS